MDCFYNHDIRFITVRRDGKMVKKWYIRDLTLNKDMPYTFDQEIDAIKKSRSIGKRFEK